MNSIPSSVSAYGWIPFVIVIVLSFLFSGLFMRYFWQSRERDRLSAVTATLGLVFALLTSLLLPVDIFLVSFMKNGDGSFKEWATNTTRAVLENGVSYTYYFLYATILLFVFFLLPLVYFAYEEKESENMTSQAFCLAFRYAIFFTVAAASLLIVGAFIPYRDVKRDNSTDWEIMEKIVTEMYNNRGAEAISFVLNILALMGMMTLIIYTGIGLTSLPIGFLRGWRSLEREKMTIQQRRLDVDSKISVLKGKESLTNREKRALSELQEEEHLISRMENEAQNMSSAMWHRLRILVKISDILFGIIGLAFGFLFWISLLLSNIDRLLHAMSYKDGYLLAKPTIFNPLNYVMFESQKVFPVDYILFFLIVLFLVSCTLSGVRHAGIRCFCLKLFKVRPHKTQPQALILLCTILMFTVLAFNILLYSTVPQYTTFGSQHYQVVNNATGIKEAVPCSHNAPYGECLITTAASFLLQYFIKAWMFSLLYFWMTWAFLSMPVITFFVMIIQGKRSLVSEAVDRDDFEDSDSDDPLLA